MIPHFSFIINQQKVNFSYHSNEQSVFLRIYRIKKSEGENTFRFFTALYN